MQVERGTLRALGQNVKVQGNGIKYDGSSTLMVEAYSNHQLQSFVFILCRATELCLAHINASRNSMRGGIALLK